jgi:hypothetical protein
MLGTGWTGAAKDKVTIKVSPTVAIAPAHLVVQATIEADPDNRAIEVVADSADYLRSTLVELDGDHSPATSIVDFRSVPQGNYEVTATLLGVDGHERARVRRVVEVLAGGEP